METPSSTIIKTSTGFEIPVWKLGSGPALFVPQGLPLPFQGEWEIPAYRNLYAELAKDWTVVSASATGMDLTEGDHRDFTLENSDADRDAIVQSLHSKMTILSTAQAVAFDLHYAATHPQSVESLILMHGTANNRDLVSGSAAARSLTAVLGISLDMYQWMQWRLWVGSTESGEEAERLGKLSDPFYGDEAHRRAMNRMVLGTDCTSDIPDVKVPVHVLHRRDCRLPAIEQARSLASSLPNSRFSILSGDAYGVAYGDVSELASTLLADLPGSGARTSTSAFQTIMFTDLESSTALTQRVGDEAAQEVLHGHNDAVRKSLEDNGGREVKHTGDGIMAAFPSAVRAVEAALQIQRDLAGGEVRVRIGLNAGEPIAEDDDFFGTAVQLAARICERAEPGQVLVSRVVADLCAGKKLSFESAGEAHMKGFDEPVALLKVGG